ncbi:hypothetical protein [Enhygromyxa salina]|nr:hypothetical protein [Enhygromyxa salina]
MRAPPDSLSEVPLANQIPQDLGLGWAAFYDLGFITSMLMILAVTISLAALLAYHPTTRAKATTIEEIEQPKTFIMYALVGAIIAIIVKVQPSMALVVFGIGGLMRFRTNVGEAKDTGRVILVTVIGLSCGLELYVVAVLTAALSWVLIFVLERNTVERVVVQGLDKDTLQPAADAYGAALRELGCTVVGEEKRVKKGSLAIIYRAPRGLARNTIEARFAELPQAERGTFGWEG